MLTTSRASPAAKKLRLAALLKPLEPGNCRCKGGRMANSLAHAPTSHVCHRLRGHTPSLSTSSHHPHKGLYTHLRIVDAIEQVYCHTHAKPHHPARICWPTQAANEVQAA
eukprot:scaffold291492_cov23-Tisochrysis_lutea.AAC.1